jgi:spore germination protein GerM
VSGCQEKYFCHEFPGDITQTVPKPAAVTTAALQQLLKGPSAEKAETFPASPQRKTNGILKSVKVENRATHVNFTKDLYEQIRNATSRRGGGSSRWSTRR